MKKIKLFAALLGLSIANVNAQAPLPTGYDFNNFVSAANLPVGWSTNISGTFTYASGQVGTAAKIDLAGENVSVFTADQMGLVTYYLKGYSTGSTWSGVFKVEESTNGTTWTALATYSNNLNATAYVSYSITPASGSRYLRWILSTKVSGFNASVDEINIVAAPVTAQEINVKQAGNTILTGGNSALFNSAVGTPTTVSFTIENLGSVSPLTISSFALTGPAASDYTVTAPTAPSTVNPSSNVPLTLSFNPSVAGTRSAILTINNDDSNEGAYVINLNGIGGSYATMPTSQPTALTFSGVKSYRAMAAFTLASGNPDGYLILKKESTSTITDMPVNGVSYKVGDAIGSSKVIYSGNGNSIGLNNIYAGKQYQLALFAYNGSSTFVSYNTVSPLTGSFNAAGSMQPAMKYSSINTNSTSFLTDLSALIYPHQSTFYGNYDETMIKLFTARDTTNGDKVVTCVYSSENYVYTEPFVWGYMSREHSYCHNWMPTNPADGSAAAPNNVERKEYNDQHHIFPTNQNDVNAVRSNFPQGDVVTPQGSYMACKYGSDAAGHHIFEPRPQHKGDFARAIMYMATAYNTQNNAFGVPQNWQLRNPISGTIAYGQDQNVLKKWHFQDLPDSWEISRNDFLDSLQGNRNPFIDSVRYACYIDFSNMTYISNPTFPCYTSVATSIKEDHASSFEYVLAPNPTSGEFYLLVNSNNTDKYNLEITDVTGRLVYKRMVDVNNGFNNLTINDAKLNTGIYFVNLICKNEKITRRLIIQ